MLLSLPFINSFKNKNLELSIKLKEIIGNKGVIVLSKIKTGEIIGCSDINQAKQKHTIGSLAKLIDSTALLEEGLITTEDTYYCKGHDNFNGQKIYCWNYNGHGLMNIQSALSESCNLFFLNASKRISPVDLLKYYDIYKLNESNQNKNKNNTTSFKKLAHTSKKNITLGLDKNLKLSSIQLIGLVNTIANKGNNLPISERTMTIVQNGMIASGQTGTANLLYKTGLNVAAKTGTAPSKSDKTHGWCIGFCPIKKPEISFCVFIKEGTGFSNAVPVAGKTLKLCKTLNYL
ncbi:MAG: penicillin-binding transpeptidase domain-containing protein [Cyanobacteriota bacterium]